jgi:hypothetical protein
VTHRERIWMWIALREVADGFMAKDVAEDLRHIHPRKVRQYLEELADNGWIASGMGLGMRVYHVDDWKPFDEHPFGMWEAGKEQEAAGLPPEEVRRLAKVRLDLFRQTGL